MGLVSEVIRCNLIDIREDTSIFNVKTVNISVIKIISRGEISPYPVDGLYKHDRYIVHQLFLFPTLIPIAEPWKDTGPQDRIQ